MNGEFDERHRMAGAAVEDPPSGGVRAAWRAADGSLLQGFAGTGGFRVTVGNCLARFCAASECSDVGWPLYSCSDGRKRKMSVTDFVTVSFDGVSYRRLSAAKE